MGRSSEGKQVDHAFSDRSSIHTPASLLVHLIASQSIHKALPCMSQRHAAAKATRAAVAAKKSASPLPSAGPESKNSDVDFARSFVEAALHGHSPLWKFNGWRSSGSDKSKNPKVNPHKYLSRRLIEGVLPADPPRKFLRQQAKLEPLKKYTRHFSTSSVPLRSYNLQDEAEEEDFGEEDPSDDAEGLPSLSLLAAKRQLQPGDWVQMRL